MQTTFALRRNEIINDELPVGEILERWPALKMESKAASKGKVAEVLDQQFASYDLQEQGDVHVRRAAVLRALPAYLHEDDSTFLRLWHVEQSDDPDIAVGLLMINARSTDTTLFCPERIAVVIEGNRVIKLPTLADAFILLFALTFALHLSYPKDLANTFDITQKVLMGLDEGNLKNLKPRVLSLKNELLAVYPTNKVAL
ncbi:hypothetical protein NQZ68_027298 [Dissostichus eleginoides]|nr:hypothetical protein NQZ68_027298 [Dissostichus eleginoides]